MTRKRQKVEEMLFAERAMDLLGENWTIHEPDNEREWPVLLVTTASGLFALEVRKLYSDEVSGGSLTRAAESSRACIKKQIASVYYKRGLPSVRVQFFGMPDDSNRFSDEIAKIVPTMKTWERKKVTYDNNRYVYICRLPEVCGEYSRWDIVSDSVGWDGVIDSSIVQTVVDKKSANLSRYKEHVEDVRLLLVCDRTKNSGKHVFRHLSFIESAGFNYIYLLSYPDEISQVPWM
jgi:hypothetical protein